MPLRGCKWGGNSIFQVPRSARAEEAQSGRQLRVVTWHARDRPVLLTVTESVPLSLPPALQGLFWVIVLLASGIHQSLPEASVKQRVSPKRSQIGDRP